MYKSIMSEKKSILLIYPPISKPCEPPAGIAKLAWALRKNNIDCKIFDANLEGIFYLLKRPVTAADKWSKRSFNNITANLNALKSKDIYLNKDRYKRAVTDLNRAIHMIGINSNVDISISNYNSYDLSPVKSNDLISSAEEFEKNPFSPFFQKRLLNFFSEQEPGLIGFSINFMSQALCGFAMAGFIKKRFPQIGIILGGGLITSWMSIPGFKNPFKGLVDDMVSGPGENVLLSMFGEQDTSLSSFSGFDYSDFPLDNYLSPGRILPYSTSSGCYWQKCKFCPENSENNRYITFDKGNIIDDIHRLKKEIKPCLIHFLDNALSPGFLRRLIENPPGVPWYGFVRITDHLTDSDFVKGLKMSGCVMLKVGIESGDQSVLNALEKGINIKTVSKALKTIKDNFISTYVYLLFGTPAETINSARMTLEFTLAHVNAISFLNLAVFSLPAYSKDIELFDTNEFYQGDLSLYREFIHPMGWNRNKVRQFLQKEFRKPAHIRSILNNDPPFFTSNHAPFLIIP